MSVPLSKIKKVSTKDLKPGDVFMNESNIWVFLENGDTKTHWCPNILLKSIRLGGETSSLNENCFPNRKDKEKKFRVLFNLRKLVDKTVDTEK